MKDLQKCSFFKEVQLEKACSDDEFRPMVNCVHFEEGYAYATDGLHLLVKAKISDICNLPDEMQDALDGKSLWRTSFAELRKSYCVKSIDVGDIVIEDSYKTMVLKFNPGKYVNVHSVIDPVMKAVEEKKKVCRIAYNPKYVKILSSIFASPDQGFDFYFTGEESPILVKCRDGVDISAIITPMRFE